MIGTEAFCYCRKLKAFEFQKAKQMNTEIGAGLNTKNAIRYAPRSKKSNLKTIGIGAFYMCISLNSVELPDGLKEIYNDAFRNSGLESITIPSSVRIIHQGAFCWCKNLKNAVLNEGLESLGTKEYQNAGEYSAGVFENSAVESIELPSTLRSIEFSTFRDCKNLKNI